MPGSGPIDPDTILALIAAGATYSNGMLVVGTVAMKLLITGNAWNAAVNGTHKLTQDSYDKLAAGTPASGNTFTVARTSYTLDSVSRGGELWAIVSPA